MKYFYDNKRHLVCQPFSIENLHLMADDLGINKCWYHSGRYPHYDIPKYMFTEIKKCATKISDKEILMIIKGL